MKEFVIGDGDDATTDPPIPAAAAWEIGPALLPPWLRPLLLLAVLEALALGLFWVASSTAEPRPGALKGPADSSYAATLAAAPATATSPAPATEPADATDAPLASTLPDGITRVGGSYRIELHGADPAQALALLRAATGATVRGGELVAQRPDRITRSLVAASALEAWQAVFGDVANFAASCSAGRCAVTFVSNGDASLATAPPPRPVAPVVTVDPNAQVEPPPVPVIPQGNVPVPEPVPAGDAPTS